MKIEVLSRFRTPSRAGRHSGRCRPGEVDLLIGTHKLLQKDVEFKDLGLLIIDEEQRFGVTHKEQLKEMCRQVDVLTLSATPIPRTLNMALSRHPGHVHHRGAARRTASRCRPMCWSTTGASWRTPCAGSSSRGGQVYYLHNRVETIDRTAARIQQLLGHGGRVVVRPRQDERAASSRSRHAGAWWTARPRCWCAPPSSRPASTSPTSTPSSSRTRTSMGLAQLHQIRGRIGRSARRAYAYLTYRAGQGPHGDRRQAADGHPGVCGVRLRLQDRHAGSGDPGRGQPAGRRSSRAIMMSVGYDMYLKLLEEAVLEEQGEREADARRSAPPTSPSAPISRSGMCLRRSSGWICTAASPPSGTDEDAADLLDELLDRYGDAPKSVTGAAGRGAAAGRGGQGAGIADISQKGQHAALPAWTCSRAGGSGGGVRHWPSYKRPADRWRRGSRRTLSLKLTAR